MKLISTKGDLYMNNHLCAIIFDASFEILLTILQSVQGW